MESQTEKQANLQQETRGKPMKDNGNQEQKQTQDKELLRGKSGYNQHASPSE